MTQTPFCPSLTHTHIAVLTTAWVVTEGNTDGPLFLSWALSPSRPDTCCVFREIVGVKGFSCSPSLVCESPLWTTNRTLTYYPAPQNQVMCSEIKNKTKIRPSREWNWHGACQLVSFQCHFKNYIICLINNEFVMRYRLSKCHTIKTEKSIYTLSADDSGRFQNV